MGSFSNYIENKILDHFLLTAAYTPETNLYLGLSTADPTDTGAGISEPGSGRGYARQLVNGDVWGVAGATTSRAIKNSTAISFSEATNTWGTISHFFICSHATNTTWGTNVNLIAHGSLSESKSIGSGDNASFAVAAISISFQTGAIGTYLSHKLLDHIFKKTVYDTSGANIYLALSTANPTDDGSGLTTAEPSGNAYARVSHTAWRAAVDSETKNTGAITWTSASASWGTVTYFAALGANSGTSTLLFYGQLDTSRAIGTNDTPIFSEDALVITCD